LVLAKHTVDISAVKIDAETNEPILKGVPTKMSDFDRNAMEEALKIKAKLGGKVKLLTVGAPEAKDQMRSLIAMGADETYLVTDPGYAQMDYFAISKLLGAAITKLGKVDIILAGEASIDLYSGQMGPRVAGVLGIPSVSYVRKITPDKDKLIVEREMGDIIEEYIVPMPALITVTKEINEPRLPNMMQILGAAKKPITEWKLDALGLAAADIAPKTKVLKMKGLTMKRKNVIYADEPPQAALKLVEALRNEGVLGGGAK